MSVSPTRFIEYLEYNRLIGVSHIYQPHFSPNLYPINLGKKYEQILDFYENEGLLTRYAVSMTPIVKTVSLYNFARRFKAPFISYCMLKHALQYDYVIVQDFDEVVGFDHNKFSRLSQVINATNSFFGQQYTSFMMPDAVVYHECSPKAPKLNYTNLVVSKGRVVLKKGLNMGKSIHSSQTCILLFAHYCLVARREDILLDGPKILKSMGRHLNSATNFDTLHLNEQTFDETIFLQSFHFRQPVNYEGKKAEFLRRDNNCDESNIYETNWLTPISKVLEQKTINVYDNLKL